MDSIHQFSAQFSSAVSISTAIIVTLDIILNGNEDRQSDQVVHHQTHIGDDVGFTLLTFGD